MEQESKKYTSEAYSVIARDFGWLIIEPLEENQVGGRTIVESIDELYNYALERYYS